MTLKWRIWLPFVLCLAGVLAGMGWISAAAIRLDRAEREATHRAEREEKVRRALVRMDTAIAPLILRESARPYFHYSPFYAQDRAYTRMYAEIRRGEVLVPSPLLSRGRSPHVFLHFQWAPDGSLSSPQAPTGNMRDLAETRYVTHETVLQAAAKLERLGQAVKREDLLRAVGRPALPASQLPSQARARQQADAPQSAETLSEWEVRYRFYATREGAGPTADGPAAAGAEGLMRPVWVGEMLLLTRRMALEGQVYVQGCWLDWHKVRRELLKGVADLLPNARLAPALSEAEGPVPTPTAGPDTYLLATLPVVRLIPGETLAPDLSGRSPVRVSLVVAWVCVLLGAGAVGGLLWGAVALSERREAFVSAVTHELRTPLTTFQMYSEMLADRLVVDEAKRQEYLRTLRAEADRLCHLVENVLAYARLERGSARDRSEVLSLGDLIQRVGGRLAERAAQADMDLVVEADQQALTTRIETDPTAVEQVLFNLVDNACKYAASASDRRLHLGASCEDGGVTIFVRDHGPGMDRREARRLFKPFRKSAGEAARTAPGVGLGLALSRRLARRMGGDLRLEALVEGEDGACFVLTLPRSGHSR